MLPDTRTGLPFSPFISLSTDSDSSRCMHTRPVILTIVCDPKTSPSLFSFSAFCLHARPAKKLKHTRREIQSHFLPWFGSSNAERSRRFFHRYGSRNSLHFPFAVRDRLISFPSSRRSSQHARVFVTPDKSRSFSLFVPKSNLKFKTTVGFGCMELKSINSAAAGQSLDGEGESGYALLHTHLPV